MTGPSIQVGTLPRFNHDDRRFRCTGLDGWYGSPQPRTELVASAGAGSVAVGPWEDAETYYLFAGVIHERDRAALMTLRRDLLRSFPATEDSTLLVYGNGEDVDLQAFVRLYDSPEIEILANNLTFALPLVATDPRKYGLESLSGTMGVFTGESWFRTYDPVTFNRTYDTTSHTRTYEQQGADASDFPPAVELTSPGDLTSHRLTIEVTGPLTRGDWFLLHEQSQRRLWADLELLAGQTLIIDCFTQRVTFNGSPIDTLVFGEFLTLEPGPNTYRLVAGQAADGFASITDALPAYL